MKWPGNCWVYVASLNPLGPLSMTGRAIGGADFPPDCSTLLLGVLASWEHHVALPVGSSSGQAAASRAGEQLVGILSAGDISKHLKQALGAELTVTGC
jgi:hypothetical protein